MMVEKILNYINESGHSQAKTAQELGVSAPMLNQYLKGKYPNPEAIEDKAYEFFALKEKTAGRISKIEFVETSIASEVYKIISYCHINRCIGAIIGDAGIGKTKTSEKYAKEYSEVIIITATAACNSLKIIYKMIAKRLRLNENRNLFDLQGDIRARLDGSNKLLIIDEAQHLSTNSIDGIRCFNDQESDSDLEPVGIVLIGNHELRHKMSGKNELAQLFNRIQMQRCLYTNDVRLDDIKLLFPGLTEKSMSPELKFLHGIAQSKYGIRGAVKIFCNAANNKDNTLPGLQTMAKYMGLAAH